MILYDIEDPSPPEPEIMELSEIKACLANTNPKDRLKAIQELHQYEPEVAIPLLLSQMQEKDFLVRSFVAMGLGKQRTAESLAALLQMVKFDRDANVRAEASNSLSLFGQPVASHLVAAFYQDDNWLVRRSIIGAMVELDCPEHLLEICVCGIDGEDLTVQEACIDSLAFLASTPQREKALPQLLSKVKDSSWRIRARVARALHRFSSPQAETALEALKQDEDHRVVAAVLENFVS